MNKDYESTFCGLFASLLTALGWAFPSLSAVMLITLTCVRSQAAIVATDQSDYTLWSTALISGAGFVSGETVQLQVTHADGRIDNDPDHDPWQVVADANGNFSTSWCVCQPDDANATFLLTAQGLTSGDIATANFSDTS